MPLSRKPGWNLNRAFALLLVAGGAMGGRKGSRASLAVALVAAAVHAEVATTRARMLLVTRTELLLAVVMGLRYLMSGKFMPAGLVSILSFVMYRYNVKFLED